MINKKISQKVKDELGTIFSGQSLNRIMKQKLEEEEAIKNRLEVEGQDGQEECLDVEEECFAMSEHEVDRRNHPYYIYICVDKNILKCFERKHLYFFIFILNKLYDRRDKNYSSNILGRNYNSTIPRIY